MLDYSKQVYSRLTKELRAKHGEKFYTSRIEGTSPPKFPAVTIVQQDNSVYQQTMDFDCHENHCKVMFQIDIYTNNKNEIDRLELAESIEETVSDFMIGLGFSRTMSKPIPNVSDMSIYRISMRFEGVIGKDALVYPH